MNKAQEDAAYYAVITAPVRYDPELSSTAKLLYCEITSLCKKKGYCWSTNSYFAELYSLSESTISRIISKLERRGHIRTKTVATAKGSERRIYTDIYRVERVEDEAPEGGTQKEQPPSGGCAKTAKGGTQKEQGGVGKKRKQNDYQGNDLSEDTPYSPPGSPQDCPKDRHSPDGRTTGPAVCDCPGDGAAEDSEPGDKPAEDRHSAAPNDRSGSLPAAQPKRGGQRSAQGKRRFVPPSVDEVRAYCQERENGIDPEAFVAYYASKGWQVGRSPMKDWRAAVHTWERRRAGDGRKTNSHDDWYC